MNSYSTMSYGKGADCDCVADVETLRHKNFGSQELSDTLQ